jgi:hypothetical protein
VIRREHLPAQGTPVEVHLSSGQCVRGTLTGLRLRPVLNEEPDNPFSVVEFILVTVQGLVFHLQSHHVVLWCLSDHDGPASEGLFKDQS